MGRYGTLLLSPSTRLRDISTPRWMRFSARVYWKSRRCPCRFLPCHCGNATERKRTTIQVTSVIKLNRNRNMRRYLHVARRVWGVRNERPNIILIIRTLRAPGQYVCYSMYTCIDHDSVRHKLFKRHHRMGTQLTTVRGCANSRTVQWLCLIYRHRPCSSGTLDALRRMAYPSGRLSRVFHASPCIQGDSLLLGECTPGQPHACPSAL